MGSPQEWDVKLRDLLDEQSAKLKELWKARTAQLDYSRELQLEDEALLKKENEKLRSKLERAAMPSSIARRYLIPTDANYQQSPIVESAKKGGGENEQIIEDIPEPIKPLLAIHEPLREFLLVKCKENIKLKDARDQLREQCRRLKDANQEWAHWYKSSVQKSQSSKESAGKLGYIKSETSSAALEETPSKDWTPNESRPPSFGRHALQNPSNVDATSLLTPQLSSSTAARSSISTSSSRAGNRVSSRKEQYDPVSGVRLEGVLAITPSGAAEERNPGDTAHSAEGLSPYSQTNLPTASEEPVFIYERPAKRRRTTSTLPKIKTEENLPSTSCNQFRMEEVPNAAVAVSSRSVLLAHDSLDLDDVPSNNHTPVKLRPEDLGCLSQEESSGDRLLIRAPDPLPFTGFQPRNKEATDTAIYGDLGQLNSRVSHHQIHSRMFSPGECQESARERRSIPVESSNHETWNIEKSLSDYDANNKASRPEYSSSRGISKSILQPMTPNMQIQPRKVSSETSDSIIGKRNRIRASVRALAEDGENNDVRPSHGSLVKNKVLVRPNKTYQRLGHLLAKSPAEAAYLSSKPLDQPLQKPSISTASKGSHSTGLGSGRRNLHRQTQRSPSLEAGKRESLRFLSESLSGTATNSRSSLTNEQITPGKTPMNEPLRSRPPEQLSLEDFKINPAGNQNLSFAYSEVVRSRDERKCLPNCSKPECCGDKFRKMVQIGGHIPYKVSSLWDYSSSPGDLQEEERRLLQQFLGAQYIDVESMSAAEKEKHLLGARAAELARVHGRHRRLHERATSPPGFWRTDMPSTQEEIADREKAQTLERQKLEERYTEAMRPNGRWLFRTSRRLWEDTFATA